MKFHTAIITHRHGDDAYFGWTLKEVEEQVLEFVKEYWNEVSNGPIPDDREEATEQYFEANQGHECVNWGYGEISDGIFKDVKELLINLNDRIGGKDSQPLTTEETANLATDIDRVLKQIPPLDISFMKCCFCGKERNGEKGHISDGNTPGIGVWWCDECNDNEDYLSI